MIRILFLSVFILLPLTANECSISDRVYEPADTVGSIGLEKGTLDNWSGARSQGFPVLIAGRYKMTSDNMPRILPECKDRKLDITYMKPIEDYYIDLTYQKEENVEFIENAILQKIKIDQSANFLYDISEDYPELYKAVKAGFFKGSTIVLYEYLYPLKDLPDCAIVRFIYGEKITD